MYVSVTSGDCAVRYYLTIVCLGRCKDGERSMEYESEEDKRRIGGFLI